MKECTFCKQNKSLDEFAVSSTFSTSAKVSSRCKECLNSIAQSKRTPKKRKIGKTKIKELLNQLSQNELTELYQLIVRRYALDEK